MPKIDTADNATNTIRKAFDNNYDILLIDYDFSNSKTDTTGNGWKIVKAVRKQKPYQPMYLFSGEGWLVQLRAKYSWNVPFVKKIWFERKPRRFFKRKQPKDVNTYQKLEQVLIRHYNAKIGIKVPELPYVGCSPLW